MAVDAFTPSEILRRIRYDPFTKKGSVYDVIQLVTGCGKTHTSESLASIMDKFPEVLGRTQNFKFPGQGQRPTPVADMPTLFRLMALLPGSRSRKFAAKSMDVFTRAFGADEQLERELKRRRKMLADDGFDDVAAGVTTTVDDALAELGKPMEAPADQGIIYVATSPHQSFFKLGFWTGTTEALTTRYRTYYGPELELQTWACDQCRTVEQHLLKEFAQHSIGGELLDKCCLSSLAELLDLATVL